MTVMMTAERRITEPTYADMTVIVAHYMHGDANGYTTETVIYRNDEESDIDFDLEGLAFLRGLCNGQYSCTVEHAGLRVREFFASNGFFGNHDEENVEDFIEQFVIQDDHDDSYEYAATLQRVEVFQHDAQGAKYLMQVRVNGEALHD